MSQSCQLPALQTNECILAVRYLCHGTSSKSNNGDGCLEVTSVIVAAQPRDASQSILPFYLSEIRRGIVDRIASAKCFDPGPFLFWSNAGGIVLEEDEACVPWRWLMATDSERSLFITAPQAPYTFLVESLEGWQKVVTLKSNLMLPDLRKHLEKMLRTENLGLDSFRWPREPFAVVNPEDPHRLSDVLDVTHRAIRVATSIAVDPAYSTPAGKPRYAEVPDEIDENESTIQTSFFLREPDGARSRKRKAMETTANALASQVSRVSFNSSRVLPKVATPMTGSAKKFLISYVRDESLLRATVLKKELEKLGASVFLDIEHIGAGMDWQDMLNDAVSQCEVFVPIVSQSYGERLWTNREVKLADILNKVIVPVSVIDFWPPASLAIQFATTQCIRWFPENNIPHSLHAQEEIEIDRARSVARQITDMYRNLHGQGPVHDRFAVAHNRASPVVPFEVLRKKRRSTLRSFPESIPSIESETLNEARRPRDGKPYVVICAHPDQSDAVDTIRSCIESECEIWSTTVLPDIWPAPSNEVEMMDLGSKRTSVVSTCSSQESKSSPCGSTFVGSIFQEQADQAGVVIVILSKAFVDARGPCKSFLFYIEMRKRMILIRYDAFLMPGWMSTLIGGRPILDFSSPDFAKNLRASVTRVVSMNANIDIVEEDSAEGVIRYGMTTLAKHKVPRNRTVYISSTGSSPSRAVYLTRKIAAELAKLPFICVATGGDRPLGEVFASHFVCERKTLGFESTAAQQAQTVFNILPSRDELIHPNIAEQNEDGTFNALTKVPGKTLMVGQSLRERESIVGRYFRVCILIDGDWHAAHEACEAIWAGNVVLPICKSGGAAGGAFEFHLGEMPPEKVNEVQWKTIRDSESSDDMIAIAVREIVERLMPDTMKKRSQTPKQVAVTSQYSLRSKSRTQKREKAAELSTAFTETTC